MVPELRCPTLQLSAWNPEKPTLFIQPRFGAAPGPRPQGSSPPP